MVLSLLIYPCNHELWYSLSLHIVLSRKHVTVWLDSVNTSPELFTGHGDGWYSIQADLLSLGSVQLQELIGAFICHSLWTTGGRQSPHLQLLETMVPPAAGVQEPADHFQLDHSHSALP